MKPRNKYEKGIVALSDKLPALTQKQIDYGREQSVDKFYVISRNRFFCLECGHKWSNGLSEWQEDIIGKKCACPSCNATLKKIDYKKPLYVDSGHMIVLSVVGSFQLIRMFVVKKMMRKSKLPYHNEIEVMKVWIDATGKTTLMAKAIGGYNGYSGDWQYSTEVSIKGNSVTDSRYHWIPEAVYPIRKILPEIKRNGFKSSFHGITPHVLFHNILASPMSETLFKSGQYNLLKEHVRIGGRLTVKYWNSIKICIRNNYIISDAETWLDYMYTIERLGMDLYNAKFVCPSNLKKAHDKVVARHQRILDRKNKEAQLKEAQKHEAKYYKEKQHFFGISFSDGDLTVSVINSVKQFAEEGSILKHCVYSGGYYARKDSLCLSARINGEVVETVEIDLKTMKINQARGKFNKSSEYNQQIRDLVDANMQTIKLIHKGLKPKKVIIDKTPQLQQA